MKECTRFHVEDVESGDTLQFDGRFVRNTTDGPLKFPVTFKAKVYKPFKTNRFGWVVVTRERIGPDEIDHFYLEDDWIITNAEED